MPPILAIHENDTIQAFLTICGYDVSCGCSPLIDYFNRRVWIYRSHPIRIYRIVKKINRDSSGQGIWLFVRTRSAMKGATIPPILAIHEHDPIPAFLTTVGNSSAEY